MSNLKQAILSNLKKVRILNMSRRVWNASKLYNGKYLQILKWGFTSKEDTNLTYALTERNVDTLAHTLAIVLKKDVATMRAYIKEADEDQVLKKTIQESTKASPEGRYADLDVHFGRRLGWYATVRALKPKVTIETGVDKGLGGILLCAALKRNSEEGHEGFYYGTDINPKAGYLLVSPYNKYGKILYGDSIESLQNFKDKIDIFINDSDHSADYEYQEYLVVANKLSENALILGDNSDATDKLLQFSNETKRQYLYFADEPLGHWYPGSGIGFSFK